MTPTDCIGQITVVSILLAFKGLPEISTSPAKIPFVQHYPVFIFDCPY